MLARGWPPAQRFLYRRPDGGNARQGTEGIILTFDVTSPKSFKSVEKWAKKIKVEREADGVAAAPGARVESGNE
jgi:hypothetical protein